ncbi:MAG TPA: MaoC family dehydratase [Caulobacteraceae bacterium]
MPGLFLEDLAIGRQAERRRVVTAVEIDAFAAVTGDENPVHLDEVFAAKTQFGGRIAHGMLAAGFISAVLGNDLPGPGAVYLSQTLRFRRPVRIGDEVVATVEVTEINETRARVSLKTVCTVAGEVVVDGEAVVLAPRRGA